MASSSEIHPSILTFEANATIYNQSFLFHAETNSYLYFRNDKNLFFVENFTGSKQSPLYWLYLALYKIPLGYYPNLELHDDVPIHQIFKPAAILIQDFIAPFYLYLKAHYQINTFTIDNELNTKEIKITSSIKTQTGKNEKNGFDFIIKITEKGIKSITVVSDNKKTVLECVEE